MDSPTIFAALRDALADLYPREDDALVVVADAGLNEKLIAFSNRAQTNWHNILATAIRTNLLETVLQIALKNYSNNPTLLAAYGQYCFFVQQGGILDSPSQLFVGDKVVIQHIFSEAELRDQNNRRILRQMVKAFWVDGVLAHSLNHEAAIRLNLADISSLVENRSWQLLPQQSNDKPEQLPPGTHIVDIFDRMNQRFLILGEPGAGKTTILLELAQALLDRAENDPTYSSPVVFNLSSWVRRRTTFLEWLIDELRTRYGIPKKLAQDWLVNGKVLPLVDGLDEVQAQHRVACVNALNEFQQEHFLPIVVCSRINEYESMPIRLTLQGAVVLQPLTVRQIEIFLNNTSAKLPSVHNLLRKNPEFQQLAQSPLLLSMIILAYEDDNSDKNHSVGVADSSRRHLFNMYIRRMFIRREHKPLYSPYQTMVWLRWLANSLIRAGQTIFLIEEMQPEWVQLSRWKQLVPPIFILLTAAVIGLIGGIVYGAFQGLIAGLQHGLQVGLIFGIIFGVMIIAIDGLGGQFMKVNSVQQPKKLWKKLRSSIYTMLFFGFIGGLTDSISYGDIGPVTIVGAMSGGLIGGFKVVEFRHYSYWTWQNVKRDLSFIIISGTIMYWLTIGWEPLRYNDYDYAFKNIFGQGLLFSFSIGLTLVLLAYTKKILKKQNRDAGSISFSQWLRKRIKGDFFFGFIFIFIFSVSLLLAEILMAPSYIYQTLLDVWRFRWTDPSYIISGFCAWLFYGIFFQPDPEMIGITLIETHSPNQSIRLSLRNSVITSLVVGMAVGLIVGILVSSDGPEAGLRAGLAFAAIVGLSYGLISGGIAVVKHGILRLILWLQGHIPWNYSRFLDYATSLIFLRKVGGGYIFVHRLIMEHFASLTKEEIIQIVSSIQGDTNERRIW